MYKDDLVKFNAEFGKIGAAVIDKCSEYMQRRIYLKAMKPASFQRALRNVSTQMSLHQTMATAIEIEPGYRSKFGDFDGQGNGGQSNRGTVGRRGGRKIDCKKCGKYHWDDEKCPNWSKDGGKPD